MDEKKFGQEVTRLLQEAILAADKLKGELPEEKREEATHGQTMIMLAMAMAYVDQATPPDERRRAVLAAAARLKDRFKFVDISEQPKEQPRILLPAKRVISS